MGSDSRLTGPPVVPDKTRTSFLDSARAIAAILVVYTHIYNVFILDHKGVHTPPTDVVDETLVNPLKLNDQGIGAISVPIFFIISGFVVTPIAWSFLRNVSLYNFIDRPFGAWVAVAWTLAVEVLFYVLLIALLPLMRRRMWLAIAVELWLVLMLLITYRSLGDEYRAFVINMVYVLIPIMGQAVWAAWTGRIPAWLAGSYVTSAWLLFVWAGNLGVDPEYVPRAFPIAFAMMLFLIGLFAEPYLKQRRVWTELSERTYSIYLLHGTVAFPLMHWGFDRFPLWLTVLIAVTATGLAAEISYRFVESPSHNLARRLSRRRDKPKEETPAADEATTSAATATRPNAGSPQLIPKRRLNPQRHPDRQQRPPPNRRPTPNRGLRRRRHPPPPPRLDSHRRPHQQRRLDPPRHGRRRALSQRRLAPSRLHPPSHLSPRRRPGPQRLPRRGRIVPPQRLHTPPHLSPRRLLCRQRTVPSQWRLTSRRRLHSPPHFGPRQRSGPRRPLNRRRSPPPPLLLHTPSHLNSRRRRVLRSFRPERRRRW